MSYFRSTLDAELADFKEDHVSEEYPYLVAAAERHLAQLPRQCEHLSNPFGEYINELGGCDRCSNSGKVYPAEISQRIGLLTTDPRWSHIESPLLMEFALAVLDALNRSAKPADTTKGG